MQQPRAVPSKKVSGKIDRIASQFGFIPTLGPFSQAILSDSFAPSAATSCHEPTCVRRSGAVFQTPKAGRDGTD
jgi:hypothetical protein